MNSRLKSEHPAADATSTGPAGGDPPALEPPVDRFRLTASEKEVLDSRAATLLDQLQDSSGSHELEVLDELGRVGVETQRGAASQVSLLRTRIGAFLDEGGSSAQIANELRALRVTLDGINPGTLSQEPFWERALAVLPGGRGNRIVRALRRVALRYESVSAQVTIIEGRLEDARDLLVRDNVELRQIYSEAERQQEAVVRDIYLGTELASHLEALAAETEDDRRRERIAAARFDVMMRVQDLRTMHEVHEQFFASLQLTRENNTRLGQAVDRTVTMATNLVTVGLALQAALVRQRRVAQAAERTRAFLGDLVTANASAINQHTSEIGDLYNSPVVAIEKVEQAHHDLEEALRTASELRSQGLESALANVARLASLSDGLHAVATAEHGRGSGS